MSRVPIEHDDDPRIHDAETERDYPYPIEHACDDCGLPPRRTQED